MNLKINKNIIKISLYLKDTYYGGKKSKEKSLKTSGTSGSCF
jgi:hypothetical protein